MSDPYREAVQQHRVQLDEIRKSIEATFPRGRPLDPASITATPKDRDEGQRIYQDFKGRDWPSVPVELLDRNSPEFLTTKGLHYYLPAYLVAGLTFENDRIRNRAVAVPQPGLSGDTDLLRERMAVFSAAERSVVRRYLSVIKAAYGFEFDDEAWPQLRGESLWA